MKKDIEKIVKNVSDLPALPWVVNKLLKVVADRHSAAKDLAEVISMDQALTAKVLKLVNSAFFGFSEKITTVSRSVVILGFHTIKSFALGISVFEVANKMKGKAGGLDAAVLWEHSIAVAAGARVIARLIRYRSAEEEAFIAGLLHDIGKIIFNQYVPEDFSQAIEMAGREGIPLIEAEQRVLGVSHESIGKFLGEQWKLPYPLREAISLHHNPPLNNENFNPEILKLICIVNLSNSLCKVRHIGFSGDGYISKTDEAVLKWLNIKEGVIERFFLEIDNELVKAKEILGILEEPKEEPKEELEEEGEYKAQVEQKPYALLIYKEEETTLIPYLFIKSLDFDCRKAAYEEIGESLFKESNLKAVFTDGLVPEEIKRVKEQVAKSKTAGSCLVVPTTSLNAKEILEKLGVTKQAAFYMVAEQETSGLVKKVLLIGDDREYLTKVIKNDLEGEGFKALVVTDPEQTIVQVREFKPDIVILDIEMKKISGLTLLKLLACELKTGEKVQDINIMIICSGINESLKKELSALNIKNILSKPLDSALLVRKVKGLLSEA